MSRSTFFAPVCPPALNASAASADDHQPHRLRLLLISSMTGYEPDLSHRRSPWLRACIRAVRFIGLGTMAALGLAPSSVVRANQHRSRREAQGRVPHAGDRRRHEARGRHAAARLGLQPARTASRRGRSRSTWTAARRSTESCFSRKGFKTTDRRPAVVVGHGINALSIGIEKYAARFAERGLVAMAIDYQSYGFSGSGSDDLRLLEADPTTDAQRGRPKSGCGSW